MAPEWWALLSWPIGVVLGCDVALTARAIGWSSSALDWWVAFLMSPLHLGIVGGLLGGWLADRGEALPVSVVPVYATVHVIVLVACGTTVACQFLLTRQEADLDAARADTVRDEHRRSAHWLHDDICAQLRLVALKVQRQDVTVAEVSLMLDELDFALRLRQLDELIDSGSVRLAEVLQPFLRNAQSHGVELERVPTYELASTEVDHDTAVSFRRAAAILSSNALNAGARSLSFDVDVTDWHVELVVTDDAGGFDMGAVVVGRGLWSLQQDLGPENLRIESTAVGSRICAIVPRGARRTRGTPLAHR